MRVAKAVVLMLGCSYCEQRFSAFERKANRSFPSCAKRSVMLILMLVGPLSAFQVLV